MAELRDQSELERTLTKDDVKQVGIVKTDDVSHDTEYQEFLRLNETFQGARLSKLHVGTSLSYLTFPDQAAQDRLACLAPIIRRLLSDIY